MECLSAPVQRQQPVGALGQQPTAAKPNSELLMQFMRANKMTAADVLHALADVMPPMFSVDAKS